MAEEGSHADASRRASIALHLSLYYSFHPYTLGFSNEMAPKQLSSDYNALKTAFASRTPDLQKSGQLLTRLKVICSVKFITEIR